MAKKEDQDKTVEQVSEPQPETELAQLEKQLQAEKEARLLALADLDNYRKRAEKEKSELMTYANLSMLSSLAELIDDFDRVTEDLKQKFEKNVVESLAPVTDKMRGIMKDYGVQEIEIKVGDKFSPSTMQAIGSTAVTDEKLADTVVHIAQKGYKYANKETIIRPVRVIIGKFTITESN